MLEEKKPMHVAMIMDGNGRWAKKRLMPRSAGHKAGGETVKRMIEAAIQEGIQVLSLFAFSSENWQRPREEVNYLMDMFLKGLERDVESLNEKNIRLRFIGDMAGLDTQLQERIADAEAMTKENTRLQLVIAVNYGGQWDILQACQKICDAIHSGELTKAALNTDVFSTYLSTQDLPAVDLLIRTSGELRISNFLLWQCAYAEFYFTETFWPDFKHQDFKLALAEYANRQRRFGK